MVSAKNIMVRTRIRGHALDRHGIAAGPDDARALATEFAVSPGVASGATAGARLAGGDIAAVRHDVCSPTCDPDRFFDSNEPDPQAFTTTSHDSFDNGSLRLSPITRVSEVSMPQPSDI